jgi:hypothetical protein
MLARLISETKVPLPNYFSTRQTLLTHAGMLQYFNSYTPAHFVKKDKIVVPVFNYLSTNTMKTYGAVDV